MTALVPMFRPIVRIRGERICPGIRLIDRKNVSQFELEGYTYLAHAAVAPQSPPQGAPTWPALVSANDSILRCLPPCLYEAVDWWRIHRDGTVEFCSSAEDELEQHVRFYHAASVTGTS